MNSQEAVSAIKRRQAAELLRQPGVSGVGVEKDETGKYILALHLDSHDPAVAKRLPTEIEGTPVKIVRSGPFRKFSNGDESGTDERQRRDSQPSL